MFVHGKDKNSAAVVFRVLGFDAVMCSSAKRAVHIYVNFKVRNNPVALKYGQQRYDACVSVCRGNMISVPLRHIGYYLKYLLPKYERIYLVQVIPASGAGPAKRSQPLEFN